MAFDLFKFTRKEYVDDFINGHIYMSALGYFWDKGVEAQKDFEEGVYSTVDPKEMIPDEKVANAIKGPVRLRLEAYKYCHLCCFYLHEFDSDAMSTVRFDERVRMFGEYAIRVKAPDIFINRLAEYAKQRDDYFLAGKMNYHYLGGEPKYPDCFDKKVHFSWQKEWRIAYLQDYEKLKELFKAEGNEPYDKPIKIDIGSLKDITEVYQTEELLASPLNVHPGYRIVEKINAPDIPYVGWGDRISFQGLFMGIDGGEGWAKMIFST